ncbi:MAG: alanine racemase [Crocinitomicaceae bacterium]|nr:alanine racemase [Crocinitomicaceae bacterium]
MKPVSGRLSSVKRPQGGVLLQDDTSHDFGALGVGLQRLAGLEDNLPRVAIVGDVPQSGLEDGERADKLGAYLQRTGCEQAWVWCPRWTDDMQSRLAEAAHQVQVTFFNHAEALCQAAESLGSAHVLMKLGSGDAVAGLKQALAPAEHITTLTINVPAIVDNVRLLQHAAGASRVIAVIKGLGYGTDPVMLGRILEAQGVDGLAVAYAEEGVRLREAGIQTRVLVLNPDPTTFSTMHHHGLEPEIVSWPHLQQAHAWAEQAGVQAWPIHLKLDTGMRRLGILPEEDAKAAALLADSRLKLGTVMSHLAAGDDAGQDARTLDQLQAFANRVSSHFQGAQSHILNTAGAARAQAWLEGRPELGFLRDTIRIGLGMYGLAPHATAHGLTPALALTSVVSKLVDVPAGHGSGYGWTDAADHDRTLAVVSAGYADGYPRSLGGGQAHVGWNGHLLPTVGRVCMDMMTVDVTGLEVHPGDAVTLWGAAPTLEVCAKQAHTIPYELLTRIGPRVQRVSER